MPSVTSRRPPAAGLAAAVVLLFPVLGLQRRPLVTHIAPGTTACLSGRSLSMKGKSRRRTCDSINFKSATVDDSTMIGKPAGGLRASDNTNALKGQTLGFLVSSMLAWQDFGNDRLSDCTFAAAGNWEEAMGFHPNAMRVISEWKAAGGNKSGIDPEAFFRWWERRGIAGIRVRVRTEPWEAAKHAEHLLHHYRFLLAVGWVDPLGGGGHEILLDGYTRRSVEYVTYGEQRSMSWREANEDLASTEVVTLRCSRQLTSRARCPASRPGTGSDLGVGRKAPA
jgi:hypothetical protein